MAAIRHNEGASATKLLDGRVLVAGGGVICEDGRPVQVGTSAVSIWDPRTGKVETTGRLDTPRTMHQALDAPRRIGTRLTRLRDGRVALTGSPIVSGADHPLWLWDPKAGGDFECASSRPRPVWPGHEAHRSGFGHLAISGGLRRHGKAAERVWYWDHEGDRSTSAPYPGPLVSSGQTMTPLEGSVIAIGGHTPDGSGLRSRGRITLWSDYPFFGPGW